MTTEFDRWLTYEMSSRELSQSDLARKAGISQTSISNVLSQKREPGPEFCIAIAKVFGISPESAFRKAGLLPPETSLKEPSESYADPAELEAFRDILRQLDPDEIEELKRIGWLKVDLKRHRRPRPCRSRMKTCNASISEPAIWISCRNTMFRSPDSINAFFL